jgi:hypothetical protein
LKEKNKSEKSRVMEIDTVEGKFPIEIATTNQKNKEKPDK